MGKNSLLSTSGVTTPNRKKSYHSIVVPMALASAIVPIEVPKPLVFACIVSPSVFAVFGFIPSVIAEFVGPPQRLRHAVRIARTS